ncbi:MAG: 5'-nucleotidase C-terminal domain-containing protein [Bacteroidales bacterium]|nr:5'-nucleotidase C-terminal domain-containing protein [Bacteroidales bacterium]
MKRIVYPYLLLLFCFPAQTWAQEQRVRFEFSMTRIDSTYDSAPPTQVSQLMEYYRPEMEREMMRVLGYAPHEMRSFRPQSPLSNFAADALFAVAQKHTNELVDFSLTNFGGIRASFPQGDVRVYDVYAVFPFENTLVILDLDGKDVQELFDNFARRNRIEAVGNVNAEIQNGAIHKLWIAGQPFDPDKRYKVATIDFLLGGGDSVAALKNAVKVQETGVMIRDAVLQYILMLKSEGKNIETPIDGRIKILDE